MTMTANKMMPTHGKRPDGLKDDDWVWLQCRGKLHCTTVEGVLWGDNIEAYCPAEPPAPYAPEPDYSKWIGKPCWFWDDCNGTKRIGIFEGCSGANLFDMQHSDYAFANCRPVTADEIVKE